MGVFIPNLTRNITKELHPKLEQFFVKFRAGALSLIHEKWQKIHDLEAGNLPNILLKEAARPNLPKPTFNGSTIATICLLNIGQKLDGRGEKIKIKIQQNVETCFISHYWIITKRCCYPNSKTSYRFGDNLDLLVVIAIYSTITSIVAVKYVN